METVGWGFLVKTSEGTANRGRMNTPMFPLEPVQPQKL